MLAAVLAIAGAGMFAVASFTGSAAGGADSPTDLGADLLLAIESEDVLGVIDVLLPGERESLGEPFVELVSELQRLEVLAETDLSRIGGLDIELANESVLPRTTNVDDIVNVAMSADLTISIDGAELPIGDLITDNMPDDMLTEMRGTRVTQTDEFDITLTAVLEDGRWYFSLLHSIAELARGELAGDVGIPVAGIGFDGADTPEGAVDQLLDRIEVLDLTGLIRSMDPGEAAALQRYAPLFLEQAQTALDEVSLDWQVVQRMVRVEGSGNSRTAFVDGLTIEGTIEGSSFSFSFDGDCVTAEMDGERVEQCGAVGGVSDIGGVFGDQPEVAHLLEVVQAAFSDIEPVGLELRERDGAWFVSPVASMTDAMLSALRALDRQELDVIIEAVPPAFESFQDGIVDSIDDLAGASVPGTALTIEGDDPLLLDPIDDWRARAVLARRSPSRATTRCCSIRSMTRQLRSRATGTTAMNSTRSRRPRVSGPTWTRVTSMTEPSRWCCATPSVATQTCRGAVGCTSSPMPSSLRRPRHARSCFLDLVAAGSIDRWELPEEIAYLQCFEGRNWYQVFDDPDYDARFEACRNEMVDG